MYDYNALRQLVGEFLGYGRRIDSWSTDQSEQVSTCVQRGYTQFLYPPPTDGRGKKSHAWRFLRPTIRIDCESGVSDCPMPPGFARMSGPFYYENDSSGRCELVDASVGQILALRQRDSTTGTYPTHAALQPKVHEGQTTQGWEVLFWPTPGTAVTIIAEAHLTPIPLSEEFPIPYGEPMHADTILESCLSIAEQYLDDSAGVHTMKWRERLMVSIDFDSRSAPKTLGYNGNGTEQSFWSRSSRATYNNVLYD